MSNILFILALPCVIWGIVSSIVMAAFLSSHGISIDLLFFRILMLKYISQYHTITMRENGKPGPWFYSFVISMNLALVFAIFGILLKII